MVLRAGGAKPDNVFAVLATIGSERSRDDFAGFGAGVRDKRAIAAIEAGGEAWMLTITAIIRAKKGHEAAMRQALLQVAENVRANEPDTIGYFISQDASDPCVFTTYERYADKAAMDRHNNSETVARFFGIAKPILDGTVTLVTATEISAKPGA